jgi:hypothetical protein
MSEIEQNPEPVLDTKPKPFVFVLMPFAREFDDVYQLGIKAACERAGAYAQRLDEQLFAESMLQRIYNQIAKADVIVADMTGRNPNVFYEVGYAHALGKVVILLTKEKEDIPFDLKPYRHIVYENVTTLLPQLETTVRWGVEQAGKKERPALPVTIYCNEIPLVSGSMIAIPAHVGREHQLCSTCLRFGWSNTDELHSVTFRLALCISTTFLTARWTSTEHSPSVHHPDGLLIVRARDSLNLLPGEYSGDEFLLEWLPNKQGTPFTEQTALRVFTESGTYSYSFTIVEQGTRR